MGCIRGGDALFLLANSPKRKQKSDIQSTHEKNYPHDIHPEEEQSATPRRRNHPRQPSRPKKKPSSRIDNTQTNQPLPPLPPPPLANPTPPDQKHRILAPIRENATTKQKQLLIVLSLSPGGIVELEQPVQRTAGNFFRERGFGRVLHGVVVPSVRASAGGARVAAAPVVTLSHAPPCSREKIKNESDARLAIHRNCFLF